MNTKKLKYRAQKGGFSLVELMVSVTIFAIVMVIATGTLLVLIDANTKAQSLHGVMSNLSFTVDSMTRDIRVGNVYFCGTGNGNSYFLDARTLDCVNGGPSLGFTDGRTGELVVYYFSSVDNSIMRKTKTGGVESEWLPITADNVVVEDMEFWVSGADESDTQQPQVRVFITGYVNDSLDTETDFELQTVVTQRKIDYQQP